MSESECRGIAARAPSTGFAPRVRAVWLGVLLMGTVASCAGAPATDPGGPEASSGRETAADVSSELDAVSLSRPLWMDKYAETNVGDMRFFRIETLMQSHGLSRLEAVEVQNAYRDASRRRPSDTPDAWFSSALDAVRAGELESGLSAEAVDAVEFVVVFDLDETLYDQYYDGERCHDLAYERADGRIRHVKFAPGWDTAIQRVAELGGGVVIFSANLDDTVYANLERWMLEDRPIVEHPAVLGVLTNSHLVLQDRSEGAGADNPRRGQPVILPSKDLRVIDPTLERVVIVDDNPTRLFQPAVQRVVKKFDAERWCADPDAGFHVLDEFVAELGESVEWMRANAATFAVAYLPYTTMGRLAVEERVASGMSVEAARAFVRSDPERVDDDF